ncbi:MAG: DUF2269 family protein [Frankiaceae bacterium]|nr:DUF2269 family protein [Frankiaceae bacterium]
MSGYEIVLSLHILAAALGFGVAGLAHTTTFRLRGATDMRQVRERLGLLDKVGPFFGIAALLLLAFGAYLIQSAPADKDIDWGKGWILTAIISLVLAEAVGGVVIGRRVKAILGQVESVPDGPVGAEIRPLLTDPQVVVASHAVTAVIASIVFIMVGKPSGATSTVIVVIGAVVGVLSALPLLKPAEVSA